MKRANDDVRGGARAHHQYERHILRSIAEKEVPNYYMRARTQEGKRRPRSSAPRPTVQFEDSHFHMLSRIFLFFFMPSINKIACH